MALRPAIDVADSRSGNLLVIEPAIITTARANFVCVPIGASSAHQPTAEHQVPWQYGTATGCALHDHRFVRI